MLSPKLTLENVDPELWQAIRGEVQRQEEYI
jgi:glycine hydroxymethyltransferase